jgi:hypothetical protein
LNFGSSRWGGSSFGFSYGIGRPIYRGTRFYSSYCPPTYYAPTYYAPTYIAPSYYAPPVVVAPAPVVISSPPVVYSAPTVVYSSPVYSAPVVVSTPVRTYYYSGRSC